MRASQSVTLFPCARCSLWARPPVAGNKRPGITLCLAFVIGLSSGAVASGASLLPNGDFESGLNGWIADATDRGMSRLSPDAARGGGQGLEVVDDSSDSGSSLRSEAFPVSSGSILRLSGFARVLSGQGMGGYLIFRNLEGEILGKDERFHFSIPTDTREWSEFAVLGIAPPESATVAVRLHSYNKAFVHACFDDLRLVEINSSEEKLAAFAAYARASRPPAQRAADHLPPFPKPSPENAFPDWKIFQPDGSPFRRPVEDWEAAGKRAAEDRDWKKWVARHAAELNRWIEIFPSDRTDWRAGWWHDFVSPTDGSYLVWTETVPGQTPLRSRSGTTVEVTDKIFEAWVFGFRGRHIDKILEASRLWRLTGESRFRAWALGQLDFYAENLEEWPLAEKSPANYSRMACQSLDEAVWLSSLAESARLLADDASPEQRLTWRNRLFYPQVELLDRCFLSYSTHNIAVWHRAAQAQISLLFDDPDLWSRAVEGAYGLRDQLRRGVTSEGFWYEQSMGYNNYIVNATHRLFHAGALAGKKNDLGEEAAIVENMMLAPLAIRFPDGSLPNPADSGAPQKVPSEWLSKLFRVFPTHIGLARVHGQRDWDTLLEPPESIASPKPGAEALPSVESKNFESSRFAVLRDGPWQVFFHYGQVCASHSQSEALNWSATFHGEDISHDTGTVGYGSPFHREYFREGLNHNVPLVDGLGQHGWNPGRLIVFDTKHARVSAEQPEYRPGVSARRELRIEDGALVDTLDISSKTPERLGFSLHFQGNVQPDRKFVSVLPDDFAKGRPKAFGYWKNLRRAHFSDVATFGIRLRNGGILRVRIETRGPFVVWQGSAPDRPPGQRSGFLIEKQGLHETGNFTIRISGTSPSPDS